MPDIVESAASPIRTTEKYKKLWARKALGDDTVGINYNLYASTEETQCDLSVLIIHT
jgi:hypothetical protein